ncbi:MAG: hypothetical protein IPM54_43425 [Polyangiaceae bacterium]|nr:hypothetical protein [Polyangiaceae bacterium]
MPWQKRSFWIAAAIVAYAAIASLRATGGEPAGWVALGLSLLVCLVGFRATDDVTISNGLSGPAGSDVTPAIATPELRGAARLTITGAALFAASSAGPHSAGFVAGENLGAAMTAIGSLWALARIAPLGGVAMPDRAVQRLDAVVFTALFWIVAVALPGAKAVLPERSEELDPLVLDYATVVASLGSLGVGLFAAARTATVRRAELGVRERARAALWVTSVALAAGVLAAAVHVLSPERVLPLSVVVASCASTYAATTREPEAALRLLRTIVAAAIIVMPVALGVVFLVHKRPDLAGHIAFASAGVGAASALVARRVARRDGPSRGRLAEALRSATRAAMTPDPEEALRRALFEMRDVLGSNGEPAALYRFFPPERLSVDRAGYMQTLKAEVPPRLVALADEEPARVMRIEALASVAVRRPEVRPLMAWMEERGLLAVSVVRDADGPIGAVVVPRGARTAPSTLAEVRALRELSDRLGAVLGVSSMLARSRERELSAQSGVTQVELDRQKLERELGRIQGQFLAIAQLLERPARVAVYSPAARAAVQRLEWLAQTNDAVTLVSAPGIDVVAWAALVHLASPRKMGVMVVIDGGNAAEHDVAKWQDRVTNPMTAAAGGTLVLVDAHLLPALVQMRIASAARDDFGLVVVLPGTVDSLAANGKLVEVFADRLGDRAVALPEISARAEDLSLLILDKLTRLGQRIRGAPLGIEPHAMAAIVEYNFPGNDVELDALLLRAAMATPADARAVSLRDLEAAGFSPPPGSARRARRTAPAAEGRRKRGAKTS